MCYNFVTVKDSRTEVLYLCSMALADV